MAIRLFAAISLLFGTLCAMPSVGVASISDLQAVMNPPGSRPALSPTPHPIRVAIGGLGLLDDDRNGQLCDLVVADLTSTDGLELVERRVLDSALREVELNLSGLVRAKDAVRVGRLVRADWFLLGTTTQVKGTNAILVRIVDARSGIIRDIAVFYEPAPLSLLAQELADFVRRSSQTSGPKESQVYLAIGGFEDLGINNRFASFPAQLRSYLATSYQGSKVTLLEREVVDALLQEVRMDLAGLTEESSNAAPSQMQSAFWIVDGFYQSYEVSGPQVDLVLRIERVLGGRHLLSYQGQPGEELFHYVREGIDATLVKEGPFTRPPTRKGEVEAQMARGKERGRMGKNQLILYPGTQEAFLGGYELKGDPVKKRRNIEEAIQAFETALALDPDNREAKMYLAACLQYAPLNRIEEARNYYREIIGSNVKDKWSDQARMALATSYSGLDNRKAAELFRTFENQCTDPKNTGQFEAGLEQSLLSLLKENGITTEKILPYIDNAVMSKFEFASAWAKKHQDVIYFEINVLLHAYRFDRAATAAHLNLLLPTIKERFPELTPYTLLHCIIYQVDTNSPVVGEFRESLEWCAKNPDKILHGRSYFDQIMGDPFRWACGVKLYDLAVHIVEIRQQMAAQGWADDLNDAQKVELAYAYIGLERWKNALELLESFGNRTVNVSSLGAGPWGSPFNPFIPAQLADKCRQHLGTTPLAKSDNFKLNRPFISLDNPFAFAPEGDTIWMAEGQTLYQLDSAGTKIQKTTLPKQVETPVTCLCNGGPKIWIGTTGDGLIEYDKTTGTCRHFTEKDGLLLNEITCLYLQKDMLWIGYGHQPENTAGWGWRGGLGQMDLRTQRITSLTPPLQVNLDQKFQNRSPAGLDHREGPPQGLVVGITEGLPGELWVAVWNKGIQRYRVADNTWTTFPASDPLSFLSSIVAGRQKVIAGCFDPSLNNEKSTRGGLICYSVDGSDQQRFYVDQGLPASDVTALALNGSDVWIGGRGFLAVMDLNQGKIQKVYYLPSRSLDKLEVAENFVWVQTTEKYEHKLFWFTKSGLPATSQEGLLSGAQPADDRRQAFIQKNFAKFVPVQFQKDANSEAALQRLHVRGNMFENEGMYYCGFKFTVPAWLDGDFEWMYILAKTEAEKDLTVNTTWGIIPESGWSEGFKGFAPNSVAQHPQLKRQFLYTNHFVTQNLDMDRLERGKTYGIWFGFQEENMPDIAFAITINSKRGTNEFGALPLR